MIATDSFNFSNVAGNLPTSSLSGVVYVDAPNTGKPIPSDPKLGGVKVILSGTNSAGKQVTATTLTANDGTYHFQQLLPGTYSLTEIDPTGYIDAKDTIGTASGTVGHDTFTESRSEKGSRRQATTSAAELHAPTHQHSDHRSRRHDSYSYQATAFDPDGDKLTFSLLEGPSGMIINSSTGLVTWTAPGGGGGLRPKPCSRRIEQRRYKTLPAGRNWDRWDWRRHRARLRAGGGSSTSSTYPVILQVADGRGGSPSNPTPSRSTPAAWMSPPTSSPRRSFRASWVSDLRLRRLAEDLVACNVDLSDFSHAVEQGASSRTSTHFSFTTLNLVGTLRAPGSHWPGHAQALSRLSGHRQATIS